MEPKKLSQVGAGKTVRVIALRGGREFNGKMASMGIGLGFELKVIESEPRGGGALLVAAGDTRLMLGCGMAEKILIRES